MQSRSTTVFFLLSVMDFRALFGDCCMMTCLRCQSLIRDGRSISTSNAFDEKANSSCVNIQKALNIYNKFLLRIASNNVVCTVGSGIYKLYSKIVHTLIDYINCNKKLFSLNAGATF